MNYKELEVATLKSVNGGSNNLLKDTLYQVAKWEGKGLSAQGRATNDTGEAAYGK